MTEEEFYRAQSKFVTELEILIDACNDAGYSINAILPDILSAYDIEL